MTESAQSNEGREQIQIAKHSSGFAEDHAGDPNFMASLARGLQVIRAFSEHRRNLTISQVSQTTGLSRAAVRRCLYTLKVLGYVGEDSKRFSLRPQVLTLGHAYLSSTPLAVVAQPYLDKVSEVLHESCSAASLDGDEIVYLCRSAETRIMSISLLVGTRLPAYCTSMGQVLLSQLPRDALEEYFARVRLVARTERTITSVPELRTQIDKVRNAGYALLDQELEAGLRSIAVPVRDGRGCVVAAINVSTHASRASLDDMQTQFLPPLKACADALGSVLLG
ncbi:IclR family transcriptional regulator C-terminal domain-containing protein [Cupriavidus basilensis]|uniref:IclR family transcriptional regulator C-terminal domain-containing protein n=1 Tax=Cupriavidus basilensis TaxID=68895 RepID=A0ABT6B4Q8_9BURK|nr:IclR family transcriptional regulator C-terminal domain-containing protein [Cupriavidus basilensis]MDF3839872.1 IclR family transcriptional regulator C-terminal domain-containing protein [Cupriavidus basilensis]